MVKRILGGFGLALALSAPAQGQVLHYTGGGSASDYNSKSANFLTGPNAAGGAFQVWCVGQDHDISPGSNYLTRYTKLNGPSFAGTRRGVAGDDYSTAQTKYTKGAWLASTMTGQSADGIKQKQFAIWAIIKGKAAGSECGLWVLEDHTAECNAGQVTTQMGLAGANYGSINKNEWAVISGRDGLDPYNPTSGLWQSEPMQELIARCQTVATPGAAGLVTAAQEVLPCEPFDPPTQEDPTPEPATMSLLALGLVAMAGTSYRKRRK